MVTEQRAEVAPSPGGVEGAISVGDTGLVLTGEELTKEQWLYMYHPTTGERVLVARHMEATQLKKGFLYQRPAGIKPFRGKIKCLLHAQDPNRRHYDELGLATCIVSNIPSLHQLNLHMLRKHKVEFATIEAEKKEREEKARMLREENLQAALLKAITPSQGAGERGREGEDATPAPRGGTAFKSHRGKGGRPKGVRNG